MQGLLRKFSTKWTQSCSNLVHPVGIIVSLFVDNISVNLRTYKKFAAIQVENSKVYVLFCPCHILHNTSSKAASTLASVMKFDIEDLAVDVGYWFDKSTKRKAGLEDFCAFM